MRKAIPTKYAGVQFRSRLEAKWAAFFDLLKWEWDYEPIDLKGYIPDFIVKPTSDQPTLFEVKPIVWQDQSAGQSAVIAAKKIDASGWPGPAIVVGAVLMPPNLLGVVRLGIHIGPIDDSTPSRRTGAVAVVRCRRCPAFLIMEDVDTDGPDGYNKQRWHDCDDSDRPAHPFDATMLWREAGNLVQWRGVDAVQGIRLRAPTAPIDDSPKLSASETSSFFGSLAAEFD
jgi:hypothetical protein